VHGDAELMARAIDLAHRGRATAPPNPWVGCVIARDGVVVGEGFHVRPGDPHAEAVALAVAGPRARRATAYVTLEPCAHHGRTPPCADALLEAGVSRVVVAVEDPDPRVRGRGLARLRARGVAVDVGVGAAAARRSLASYLHHRATGRAFCLLKTATSLDGRVAAADGTSRWVTGSSARADAHELRAESQAVVIGSGTALADRPRLTVRDVDTVIDRQPLRVLLDARGRVRPDGPLFDITDAPTLVVTSESVPERAIEAWRAAGAKVETVPVDAAGRLDLRAVLTFLGHHDVLQAMFEGGPTLHGSLVATGLVDRVVAYVAGTLLGTGGRPTIGWQGPATLPDAPRLRLVAASALDDDVRLEYAPADWGH
jgi:diaminohydroxyphosphoribosylaminopyrimidine deaminase / 5-amino-6-(5-phosphoribosylamino)uracil reductase